MTKKKKIWLIIIAIAVISVATVIIYINTQKKNILDLIDDFVYDRYLVYCLPDSYYDDTITEEEKQALYDRVDEIYSKYMIKDSDIYLYETNYAKDFLKDRIDKTTASVAYHSFNIEVKIAYCHVYLEDAVISAEAYVRLLDENDKPLFATISYSREEYTLKRANGRWYIVGREIRGIDSLYPEE